MAPVTFMRFQHEEAATEVAQLLAAAGLQVSIEDSQNYFDPSFARTPLHREIRVLLPADQFKAGHQALQQYYAQLIQQLPPDYPVLSFSTEELQAIVAAPDEWGHLDYVLAKQLLAERGISISPQQEEATANSRLEALSQYQNGTYLILLGYIFAVLSGAIALILGMILWHSSRTLPNGQQVHVFSPASRFHGKMIVALALGLLAALFLFGYYLTLSDLVSPFL